MFLDPRAAAPRTKRLCSARAAGSGWLEPPARGEPGAARDFPGLARLGKQTQRRRASRGPPGPTQERLATAAVVTSIRAGSQQPARRSMAAIPSSGSLVATHDYYRRKQAPCPPPDGPDRGSPPSRGVSSSPWRTAEWAVGPAGADPPLLSRPPGFHLQ